MATQQATRPVPVKAEHTEPLRHRICACQRDTEPSFSWCGLRMAGMAEPSRNFKPMELCGLCALILEERQPCKHCGRRPFS